MLAIDQTYEHEFKFSQDDVVAFSRLTGDNNPIHLDEDYAANSPFKKPIIHGMLGASVFSKVLGTLFPGKGTIYLSQELEFKRPMFVDIEYKAHFKVKEIFSDKNRAVIQTSVADITTGKETIAGEARVMLP